MNEYRYYCTTPDHVSTYLLNPILEYLKKIKNPVVLDIGCGNGWLVNELLLRGYTAYGTDASVSGIEMAGKTNPGHFFVQDLTKDHLPNELINITFNTLISTEVIEHLYSPQEYIEYCKKILQPHGGEIIISTPYHGYLKNLILAVTGKMDAHFTALWEGGHIKFWSKKTLSELLTQNGFQIKQFKGCGRIPLLWKSMIITANIN